MTNSSDRKQPICKFVLIIIFLIVSNGCAIGVTRVHVAHDLLAPVDNTREGDILIKQFTDERTDTYHIGNKRNTFGMVLGHIGTLEGVELAPLLTKYFAEALSQAGYNAIIEDSESDEKLDDITFDVVLEGEIKTFWLDLYMAT